jgi:signal transduction histidine kinase
MAVSKQESSIFHIIFIEGIKSFWLPGIFAANIFLTGFLLPTESLEAGYTLHHWDFVIAISGALLLLAFRPLLKDPKPFLIAAIFLVSGLGGAYMPYIWAEAVLPHGIPDSMADKWAYGFVGPVAQIVVLALAIGSVRYWRKISNAVAESRAALNILRRDLQEQIENERKSIVDLILATVKPALLKVESAMNSGADREEISANINVVIAEVVRPLSHQLDASASKATYEINRRLIKRGFRKQRIRQSFKSEIPVRFAVNAPLSIFAYINFNVTTLAYIYGFKNAAIVSVPFLISTTAIFLVLSKLAAQRTASVGKTILLNCGISLLQTLAFSYSIHLLGPAGMGAEEAPFALTTFLFTLLPSLLGIILLNLRANLEKESEITSEIAKNISIIKRQLWSLHKKFAREIHGGLQSQLQILALKFEREDLNHAQVVEEFNSEIKRALTLDTTRHEVQNLEASLQELKEFWDGIVTIKTSLGDGVTKAVEGDILVVQCLYEVIREAVNNAVKHSGADQISILLRMEAPSSVFLEVLNHVNKEIPHSRNGNLGTAIYKELSHSWKLDISRDVVSLKAEFILKN